MPSNQAKVGKIKKISTTANPLKTTSKPKKIGKSKISSDLNRQMRATGPGKIA